MTGLADPMDPDEIFNQHPDLLELEEHQRWLAGQVDRPYGVLTDVETFAIFQMGIRPGQAFMAARNDHGTLDLHLLAELPAFADSDLDEDADL